jgi:hypothetical protein
VDEVAVVERRRALQQRQQKEQRQSARRSRAQPLALRGRSQPVFPPADICL